MHPMLSLSAGQLSASAAAQEAQDEHEHVEQIEIDLHGGEHVVILPELGRSRMKRHVSNTSRPLKISTPTADIHRYAPTLATNELMISATMSTTSPTVRKLPHALKSRRLVRSRTATTRRTR